VSAWSLKRLREAEELRLHRRRVQRMHQIRGLNRFDARGVVYGKAVDEKGRPFGGKVLRAPKSTQRGGRWI
jgi:hypothetical protein